MINHVLYFGRKEDRETFFDIFYIFDKKKEKELRKCIKQILMKKH